MQHSLILCQEPRLSPLCVTGEFFTVAQNPFTYLRIVHQIGATFYGVVSKIVYHHPQPKVCRAVITFATGTTFDVSCHLVPDVYKDDVMAITAKKRWSKKRGHYFEPVIKAYRRHVTSVKKKRKQ